MPVSQEVHFAHHLAANEKVTRDRALRKLTKWIRAKSGRQGMEFTEDSLMKLWKGLFFCMWMSDKPFVQQELANSIAGLVHCFAQRDQSLMFLDAFFKTMAREWFAIDRFRLEKFMMLVRRCFRQGVAFAYGDAWSNENVTAFCDMLQSTALCPNSQAIPLGLRLHVVDVFLQELARMHGGELTPEQATLFLQPFFDILMHSNDRTLLDAVRKNVFFMMLDLDREAVELGVDPSSVKIKGSNGTTEDDDSAEEEEEDMYDEHGRVLEKGESCQDLPAIPFDYSTIADRLFDMLKDPKLKPFNRGLITRMVKKFRTVLEEGLVRPPVEETIEEPITEDDIEAAASKLEEELEEELKEDHEEVLKLKKERDKGKPKFGFDSSSGAYEYIFNHSGDSEDDEGSAKKTGRKKRRPKEKQPKRKTREVEIEEGTDTCDSDKELVSAKTAGRKRKRSARLSGKTQKEMSAEGASDGAESSQPPKKKQRKRKPKKPKTSSDGTVQKMAKLNSFDNDAAGIAQRQDSRPIVNSKSLSKLNSFDNDAAGIAQRLDSKPTVNRKSLSKLNSFDNDAADIAQRQDSKPTVNSKSSVDEQQKKINVVLRRRQARKQRKEKRRLSALTPSFKVTPLPEKAGKAEQVASMTTPTTSTTQTGEVAASIVSASSKHQDSHTTETSPSTPFRGPKNHAQEGSAKSPRQTPQADGEVTRHPKSPLAGNVGASTGLHSPGKRRTSIAKTPVSSPKKNLNVAKPHMLPVKANAATEASPQGLRPIGKFTSASSASHNGIEVKASGDDASIAKSPSTPKTSNQVAPSLRKCLTESKANKAKLTKFSTPPAQPSSTSQEEKRVIFALSKNKAQDPREYFETLKNSPEIPFDASKKPAQGVLKARLSLPSSTPVQSAKKRGRASDFFQSNVSGLFCKKRSNASDFF
uniref:Putative nucleolar protein n=1 Tax=Rhipicephalus microplus TaxID=6941 RepID=A0A6M2CSP1_RHIMP